MLNAERAFRYLPTIGYTYVRPRQVAQIRVYWNQSRRMITGGGSRVGRYLSRGVPADELEARRQQRMQTASCANTRAKPILRLPRKGGAPTPSLPAKSQPTARSINYCCTGGSKKRRLLDRANCVDFSIKVRNESGVEDEEREPPPSMVERANTRTSSVGLYSGCSLPYPSVKRYGYSLFSSRKRPPRSVYRSSRTTNAGELREPPQSVPDAAVYSRRAE